MLCRRHGFLLSVWRLGHSKCYIYVLNIWGMLQADELGMIYCWLYMWLLLSIMIIETIYISEWTLCWNCYIFFMASINPDFIWLFRSFDLCSVYLWLFPYIHVSCWFQFLLWGKSLHVPDYIMLQNFLFCEQLRIIIWI